jgi:hypothetical protein
VKPEDVGELLLWNFTRDDERTRGAPLAEPGPIDEVRGSGGVARARRPRAQTATSVICSPPMADNSDEIVEQLQQTNRLLRDLIESITELDSTVKVWMPTVDLSILESNVSNIAFELSALRNDMAD